MTSLIYVLSLHHTGTWFTIRMLCNHPQVKGFLQMKNMERNNWHSFEKEHGVGVKEKFVFGELNVVHRHFEDHRGMPVPDLNMLAEEKMPVVVPLRDPLLTLLSGQGREKYSCQARAKMWVEFVETLEQLKTLPHMVFIPVDLWAELSYAERVPRISRVYAACRLNIDQEHLSYWSSKWPVVNPTAHHDPARKIYKQGEARESWTEMVKCLRKFESQLRPFLERQGYGRLPWYTEQLQLSSTTKETT